MKKILFLGTGGTIASEISGGALSPALSAQQLLQHVPEVSRLCDVDAVQLFTVDSTNITPEHWRILAREIIGNFDRYDGFVIAHGTDTLAYTAAALSYLIQNSPKPVILTGAQKPIGFDSTDSKINLEDAFRVASAEMPGVSIVFNGKIILGTRAQKTHSKSFQAFSSINYPVLGVLRDGALLPYIRQPARERPEFFDALDPKVGLLKLTPGCDRRVLDWLLSEHDAVIIESFGVGGVPEAGGFYESIREGLAAGKTVVLTTQVQNEGSDLTVYLVGHRLKDSLGVLEAYDMTTEAVYAKLMWILARTRDREEIERLFYTPVAKDILWTERA